VIFKLRRSENAASRPPWNSSENSRPDNRIGATQTARALDNVKVVLEACGPDLNQIVVIVG
jgi:enamine deaminase RidA (YjgF/YER057c/UK114 family)